MKIIYVKRLSAQKIQSGNPLLVAEDLAQPLLAVDGDMCDVYQDKSQQFLGKVLINQQNKGIGWIVSTDKNMQLDETFLKTILQQAIEKRNQSDVAQHTNAYRLFNGESDGLGGVTIDVYDNTVLFTWYGKGIYAYSQRLIAVFEQLFDCVAIYEKCRFDGVEQESRCVKGSVTEDRVEIVENGVRYATYMNDGWMTGIFLDQREVRAYIQENCDNQRVLNTFSYTGAFSVSAAKGGAAQTTSVDVAKRSVEKMAEHFAINNIDMADHNMYVMDVFDYFKYAMKKLLTFDWVILDPPSFARTKKRTFSVTKNYKDLLKDAIAITEKNGRIVVSTNAANYPEKDFKRMIAQAFSESDVAYVVEKIYHLPTDFTVLEALEQTNYLKVYIVQRIS